MLATNWDDLPLVLTPQDLKRYGLYPGGTNRCYELWRRKDFPGIRHGQRLFVSRDAYRRWLEREMN